MSPPTPFIEVPHKPLGRIYGVVLRAPDFSHGKVAAAGAFGGKFGLPLPELGEACVCCDEAADGRRQPLSISTDRYAAEPVPVPVCEECAVHALGNVSSEILAGSALCVGLGGGLWGAMKGYSLVALGGAVILAGTIAWMVRDKQKRLAATKEGHHPGFQILIAPGQCVIRTANRRVAIAVATAHADLVHRIR